MRLVGRVGAVRHSWRIFASFVLGNSSSRYCRTQFSMGGRGTNSPGGTYEESMQCVAVKASELPDGEAGAKDGERRRYLLICRGRSLYRGHG